MERHGRTLNRTELAEFFAVAPTTVDAWVRRGCPALKRATGRGSGGNTWQFDSAAVVEWLREQAVQNAIGDIAKIDEQEARRRKIAAEAALAEYELAERRREMIRVEDYAVISARRYAACRARLLGVAPKVAPQLLGLEEASDAQAIVAAAINEALTELVGDVDGTGSDGTCRDGGGADATGEPQAAAEADPKRVGRSKSRAQSRGGRRAGSLAHKPR